MTDMFDQLDCDGITACDFKPQNMVIDNVPIGIKIIDFGGITFNKGACHSYTPEYAPPEINKELHEFIEVN